MHRRHLIAAGTLLALRPAWAHHGWSSFDQARPLYLEGRAAQVTWGNPHAEVMLDLTPELRVPSDLATRTLPPQSAAVDGAGLMKAARVPTRKDRRWELELAPISRMEAWKVPEIKVGDPLAVVGFTTADEKGEAVLRVEYLFLGGRTYGLRSSPA
jgi:Family of unknown function (DUF6152)